MPRKLYHIYSNTYFILLLLFATVFSNHTQAQFTASTFVYTGAVQTYTVPAGVVSVTVDARGANGGFWDDYYYLGIYYSRGGYGARVVCSLAVTSGQVLYVNVGGNGDSVDYWFGGIGGHGGWNGGGNGYSYYLGGFDGGGGGGGGTDIRTGGTAFTNRVIVAGGGGGGGYDCTTINYNRGGDGGGLSGEEGYTCNTHYLLYDGGGGTQSAGGAAATVYTGIYAATPGGVDTGGTGAYYFYGGGGGGGYYGGGGGAYGGGGGGSSYTDTTQTTSVFFTQGYNTTGNDSVFITVNCSGGVINGIPAVCVGSTTTLSDTVAFGSGTWSSSNTAIATVGSSTGVVTGISGGTASITYSVIAYCGTVYSVVTLTVNPMPTTILGTKVVCAGSKTTLSDALSGGTWNSSNTAIATIDTFTGTIKGVSSGTATITYSTGVGVSCTAVTTVTVNPVPVAITGGSSVCLGLTLALSDVTTGATWSSTLTSIATIGSTGIVTGVSPGTSVISYTLVSTGCAATDTLTVNPLPGGISGLYTVCVGLTTALTDAGGGTWSSSATSVATVGSSTGVVSGVTGGRSTITYTLPTGCITTATITVFPLPGSIGGTKNVCVGLSATLSDGTGGGTWSSGSTGIAAIGTGSGIVTGILAGTATITYSLATGCIVTSAITVNPLPSAITGVTGICTGATTTLSDGGGGTWSSGSTGIATIGVISGILSGISAGTATITYTLPTGCIASTTITVYPLPTAISGPAHVCPGSTITLSDATGGGVWASLNLSLAGIGSSSGIVTGLAYGTDTITYMIGTGCAASVAITIDSLPSNISGPANLCVGTTTVFSDAGGGTWSSSNTSIATIGSSTGLATGIALGTATITYVLPTGCMKTLMIKVNALPGGILGTLHVCVGSFTTLSDATGGGTWSSGSTSATVGITTGVVSGLSAGTATITYTLFSTGCLTTTTVTVSPAPAAITGITSVCAGQTTLLSDAVPGGTWSSSNTAVAAAGSSSGIITGISGGTATITYSPGAGCAATKTVTVHPLTVIIGPTTICVGATTSLTDGALGGTWSSSNTAIATVVTGSGVVTGVATGTTIITYLLPTGCSATVLVTVSPSPAAILGASSVCTGSTTTLSDAVTGGLWSSSNSAVAGVGTTTGVVSGVVVGTATISYSLGGSCIVTKTMTVNLSPSAITGVMSMCVGATSILSDAGTGGAWSSSNTGIATIGGTGITTGVSAGTAIITYNSGCIAVATVTVIATPVAISGPPTVCAGLTTALSDGSGGGTWSCALGVVSVGSATGIVSGISAGTAIISYSIGTSCVATQTETVYPLSPITGATTICVSATTALTDGAAGGTWSSSNTAIATVITGSGIVTGVATGTAIITYLLPTGCTATTMVTVSPSPLGITGAGNVCVGLTTVLSDAITGGAWSSSSTATAAISGTGVVTGLLAGTSVISYSLGTSCIVTKTMSVNASPSAITGTMTMCIGATVALTDVTTGGVWSSGSTSIATVSGTGVVTGVSTGTAPIMYTVSGCFATVNVTVNPMPSAITGTASICAGNTTSLSDLTTGGAWSSSNTTVAGVGSGSGIVSGISAGTTTITYATGVGCAATKTATVNPLSAILGTTNICAGNTTALSDATIGGVWSSSNTGVATISGSGLVTGVVTGTSTITYLLLTGCAANVVVKVNSIPSAITGITQVCAGATTALSDGGGGVWSSGNTAKATIGAGTGVVTGVAAGTSVITYSLGTGCTVNTAVTVNSLPLAISGSSNVCAGLTIALSDITTGGAWSSSNTAVATIAGTGIVTGVIPGTSVITYSLVTGCTATKTINVSSTPTAITGALQVCPGNSTALTDLAGGGTWTSSSTAATVGLTTGVVTGVIPATARITYSIGAGCTATAVVTVNPLPSAITGTTAMCVGATASLFDGGSGTWNSDNTVIATITGTGVVTGMSIGTADITYTLLSTGCIAMQAVTVNSLPPAISGMPEVCAGQTTALSDAGGGVWSSSSKVIATVGTGTGIVTGVKAGMVTITYSLGVGCNTVTSVTVDVIPPAISGAANVCTGATTTLSDVITGGAWSNDNTAIATIGAGSGIVSGLSAGTTTVSYVLAGCPAVEVITVNPLPSAIGGTLQVCLGASTALSDGGGGTWSSPGYTGFVIVGSGTGFVTGIAAGTAMITYTLPTGCTTSVPVTINPVPSAITGPSHVCAGLSISLSDLTTSCLWSSGNTVIATVTSGGVVTGDTGGVANILYTFPVTGCSAYKTVTVNPAVPAITGVMDMCAGGKTMYVADADTPYGKWTSTFVTISTGGMVSTYDTGVGVITYTMPTGCFTTATLTVNPQPSLITGPVAVCTGQSIFLNDSASGGLWSSGSTTLATAVSGSGMVTGVSAGVATISYAFPTGCAQTYNVTVYQMPAAITGLGNVCAGSSTALSDTLGGGAWSSRSGIAIVSGIGLVTGISAGTAVIEYTSGGGCTAGKTVTVEPLPLPYSVTGGGSYCAGGAGFHVYLGGSATGTKYELYDGGTLAGTLTGSGASLDFGLQTVAGDYKVLAINTTTSCSNTMPDSAVIVVNPLIKPSVSITATPSETVCAGTPVTFTAIPVNGGLLPTYQWKVNGLTVGGAGATYTFTPADGNVVIAALTSSAVCATPPVTDTFITMTVITPVTPSVVISADPGTNIGRGGSVTLTATVAGGGTSPAYEWLVNGVTVPGANTDVLTLNNLAANDTVVCIVTSGGLCSMSGSDKAYITVSGTGVGVKQVAAAGIDVMVIPNPSKGDFVIKGSLGSINDEEVSLEITDLLGQVIYKAHVPAYNGNINEQIQLGKTIANGMYLLNLRSEPGNKVFHIVVEQ